MQEFWKSVKIQQSYHEKFDAPFFGTQCMMMLYMCAYKSSSATKWFYWLGLIA